MTTFDKLAKLDAKAQTWLRNFTSSFSHVGAFRKMLIIPALLLGTAAAGYYRSYKYIANPAVE